MPDLRDFEEPFAAPDATDNEKSTRWILIVCFGILLLAGIAFASLGNVSQPLTSAMLTEGSPPPQALIITPGPSRAPRVD